MPDSTIDQSSSVYDHLDDPLYLSASDQPTLQLVSPPFSGDDFVTWKREIYHTLLAKNKEGFLDGSCKLPAKTDKKYHQWIRVDLTVKKWILNSIVKDIRDSLQFAASAKILWDEIIDRYGQSNYIEIYRVKKRINSLAQGNSSVVEYYSGLKRSWELLDELDPLPLCNCGAIDACTCSMLKRQVTREVNAKLIHFMMGLNESYESVTTNLLSSDSLPALNKALALYQKIESQKLTPQSLDSSDITAFNSFQPQDSVSSFKKPKFSSGEPSEVKECSYCHYLGHTKAECFKLNECIHCGRRGHAKENCFKLKYGSNYRGGNRGRGRNTSYTARGGSIPKRGANTVDVLDSYVSTDPLCEDVQDYSSQPDGSSSSFDPSMMTGLVNTVVEQVMRVMSDKNKPPVSSANFAGPFK